MIEQTNFISNKLLSVYLILLISFRYLFVDQPINKLALYAFILAASWVIFYSGFLVCTSYCLTYSVFFLYCLIQTAFLRNDRSFATLYETFTCLILILLLVNTVKNTAHLKKLFFSLVIGGTLFSFLTFSEYHYSFARVATAVRLGIRIGTSLTNPNYIGMICSYSGCIGLFLFFDSLKKKNTATAILLGASSLFCILFALLSGSRKTYLTLFLGFGILIFSLLKQKLTLKRAALILVVVFVGLILFINLELFSMTRHRLLQLFLVLFGEGSAESSINHRDALFHSAIELFQQRPFIGNGLESVRQFTGYYAHNNFAELLANNGFIGFTLYYSGIIITLHSLAIHRGHKGVLYYMMLFTVLSILVNDIAQVTYYDRFDQLRLALINTYFTFDVQKQKEYAYVQKDSYQKY